MMRTVRWLSGLTLLLSMGLVSWGQSVPLQIDAVKKSGAKKDVGGGRAFGGTTQTESKEK